jgi:alpha-amylase
MKGFKKHRLAKLFALLLTSALFPLTSSAQGWPDNYGGVMLQGFYWDSYKDTRWALLEQQAPDLAGTYDLIWIPQSGNCGAQSMGYDDLWWFNNYNSSFGNEAQLRSMIQTFKALGLGTIADVVINHRSNVSTWTDFPEETYNGVTYQLTYKDICSDDEAAKEGYEVGPNKDTGEGWPGMRDLDHKSENVQTNVKAYLNFLLNDLGYTGFRYDMVKGYSASYTKMYNEDSKPQFSVGECWDSSNTIRNWIDGTEKTSAAFDFQFKYVVGNACNSGDWTGFSKQNQGNWPLVSTNFESGAYRQYAVTFVENHDTEVRPDGSSNGPLKKDTLAANAYMLAMPGTPCIFLKHWQAYKEEIKAMVAARKLAGITNTSEYLRYSSPNIKAYYAITTDDKLLCVVGDESKLTLEPGEWTKILSGHHYAYYLANSMETAWANKGSGTFTEPFDVELKAVSNTDDAMLVYTLDGSEPSATNGTQCLSGTLVRIEAPSSQDSQLGIVLKVGLLVNGAVSGIITRSYVYQETAPSPEVVIPDFCTVADGEVCAFFEAPSFWESTICCWAWVDKPYENFTYSQRKDWPGIDCQLLGKAPNGNTVWKWTWDGTKQNNTAATQPEKIIFNNTGQPQTGNLDFTQAGYYNEDGLQGVVTATAIHSIVNSKSVDRQSYYDLQGRRMNGYPIKKGIYIHNGKKTVIK